MLSWVRPSWAHIVSSLPFSRVFPLIDKLLECDALLEPSREARAGQAVVGRISVERASTQVSLSIPEARGTTRNHTYLGVDVNFNSFRRHSEHLGEFLGASRRVLGASQEPLRDFWVPLGGFFGAVVDHIEAPLGHMYCGIVGCLGALLGRLCALLAVWEVFGGRLGLPWSLSETLLGQLGDILGPSWADRGLSCAILRPSRRPLGHILGPLTPSCGHIGGLSGRLDLKLALKGKDVTSAQKHCRNL